MAKLIDHTHKSQTLGSVDSLIELMITSQMNASKFKGAARERHATAVVKAAVRRGGRTDAKQQLIMSGDERQRWEAAHPIESR